MGPVCYSRFALGFENLSGDANIPGRQRKMAPCFCCNPVVCGWPPRVIPAVSTKFTKGHPCWLPFLYDVYRPTARDIVQNALRTLPIDVEIESRQADRQGTAPQVFVHPDNPDWCIKVIVAGNSNENHREAKYYGQLAAAGPAI